MKMKTGTLTLGFLVISSLLVRADLIHQWTFANTNNLNDAITGTANRLIFQQGTRITNAVVYTNDTPFGPSNALSGYSLSLLQQSNNCYVFGSGTATFTPSNMTFAAWVKINGWTATDDQWESIFAQIGTGAGFRLSRISNLAYSGVDFVGASYARDSGSKVNIADNTWHHVAFTYDSSSSNLTYYVDGVQKAQAVTPYYPTTSTLLSIGAYNTSGTRSINGLLYDVRIYNTALPAWQVASLTNPPSTVLFSDAFNSAVSTNLFDPTGRATGSLATNTVYYGWSGTNDLAVNDTLSWAADHAINSLNELTNGNSSTRNLHFAISPNSTTQFDWYPYVSNKVWDVDFDEITANSQPLGLGVTSSPQNGNYNPWDIASYDFGFGNYGAAGRWDIFNQGGANSNNIPNIFASKSTVYHVRIQFNELLHKVTMSVNGTQVAQTNNLIFGANHRYLVWGEPSKFGGYLDNVQISVEPSIPVVPFAVIPAAASLIANGSFTQVANAVLGAAATAPTTFNINGSRGDFTSLWGSTADVLNWSPYYSDPNGLTTNCVPFTDDPSYVLNGTYYLDTLIETNSHAITLNSADYYLNGLVQTNILNGATIKSGAQYQLVITAGTTASTEQYYATFAAGLTAGLGANATNLATAVPNSSFSMWAHNLPTSGTTNITSVVHGADLLAAQGSGPVNVVFNQINTNGIAGYPVSPNPQDISQVSQVKVSRVSLTVVVPANDLNHDGVVDQNDVHLAQSCLDGSIDGGDWATNRENTLINTYGFSPAQALAYLNLTSFDLNGDNYFDAADVAALQALVGPVGPALSGVSPDPVAGSSYPVRLTLTGSGFSGATAVLLTNLTAGSGASYSPVVNSDSTLSVSFVPGTAGSSWNATVVNGLPSAQAGFTVKAASAVSLNNAALTSAGAGKLVLAGTGGGAGNSYVVLSATNLAPPVVWAPVATNLFDAGGNFSYTNAVDSTKPSFFLRLQQ